MALAAHYMIYDVDKKEDLCQFLETEVEGFDHAFDGLVIGKHYPVDRVNMSAKMTSFAVLNLIDRHDTLSGIITEAVEIGGDTDSVAALAVAIGSCSKEITNDLPETLIDNLDERGEYGVHYLRAIDTRLDELKNSSG